jgi:hypothetical protein
MVIKNFYVDFREQVIMALACLVIREVGETSPNFLGNINLEFKNKTGKFIANQIVFYVQQNKRNA